MRKEEVIEKATELGQKYFPDECNVWARANTEAAFVRSACIEMSEWADKTMIEKACEWLKKHYAPAGFVDGIFRKAMEE